MSDVVYRAAIVGCGRVGCFFDDDRKRRGIWTHAGAYAACPRTELVALADLNPETLEKAGRRWGVKRIYPVLSALLKAESVEILSVCTPSNSHAEAVRAAAAAGARAVWCEKPMTVSLTEAQDLLEMENAPIIAVNHIRRWDHAYEVAREHLRKGRLGKLLGVTAWYTHGISNIGSHLLDILRFLLGEPSWIWAVPDRSEDPDPTLSGAIGWEAGFSCQVVGCGRDFLLFEIDLVGTEGRMRVSGNGSRVEVWRMEPSARYSDYREPGNATLLWEGEDERRMLSVVEEIVRCLEEGGSPRCSVKDGLKAIEMVSAFLQSARSGQRIDLPLVGDSRQMPIPVR